jgi:divalent metal cation (Fe/Co/Zn/Cd) transporter
LLSKIILAILLFMLLGRLGLRAKLRNLKPKLDRAVNITLLVLGVTYVGQLLWLYVQRRVGR